MTQVTVTSTPVKLASAGNREFVSVFNNDTTNPIYLGFDGAVENGTTLTTANGWPVPPQTSYQLSNDGHRQVHTHEVWAVSAGSCDVRIQGA